MPEKLAEMLVVEWASTNMVSDSVAMSSLKFHTFTVTKPLFLFFGKLQVLDKDNEVKLLFSRSRCGEVPVRHVVLGCVMGLVVGGAKGGPGNISIYKSL